MNSIRKLAFATFLAFSAIAAHAAELPRHAKHVILVHGAFVDGSGWFNVYKGLREKGFRVTIVQNPGTSLDQDVAVTKLAIAQQDGPVVLVGHSYGGVVITEAGADPKVEGLVYIAAFAPDAGESVKALAAKASPEAPKPPILPPQHGFLLLDRAKFAAAFAADLPSEAAAFLADSQVPWGMNAFGGAVTTPAWKAKPSFYLVAKDDRMIPPAAQRQFAERIGATVSETTGSHAVYVSRPQAVIDFISEAATSLK